MKKIRIKKPKFDFELLLLYGFILVTSWQIVMPTTYFDELFLIALIIYEIAVKKIKWDRKSFLAISIYVLYCCLGLVVNFRISMYSLFVLLDSIKPNILLLTVSALKLTDEKTKKVIKFFTVINLISVVIGLYNTYSFYYGNGHLLFDSGNRREVGNIIQYRMNGLTSHVGEMATNCLILIAIFLFKDKHKILDYILLGISFVGLLATRGRFTLIACVTFFAYFAWNKTHLKGKRKILVGIPFVIVIFIIFFGGNVLSYYAPDLENQVRFAAWKSIINLLPNVLMLGVGIGNIGNEKSILYNRDLYSKVNEVRFGNMDWESTIGKSLLQTGVFGTILLLYPLIRCLKKIIKARGEYHVLTLSLFLYYLVDLFLNKAYDIPFIGVLAILVSNQLSKGKTK